MTILFGLLGQHSSAPPAWTPASLSPGLWLDAGVGVTLDGSSRVTGWADQSGHGRDATGAGAWTVVPNWSNGKPALAGDGATLLTNVSSAILAAPNSVGYALAVVDNPTFGGGGAGSALLRLGLAGATVVLEAFFVIGSHYIYGDQATTNENLVTPNQAPFDDPLHLEWILNGGDGTNTVDHYIAGVSQAIASGVQSSVGSFGAAGYNIGGAADGRFWQATDHIAEIVVGSGALSGPNLASWTSYVKTKYGLAA